MGFKNKAEREQAQRNRDAVLDYIENVPGCDYVDITMALGMSLHVVKGIMYTLIRNGSVYSVRKVCETKNGIKVASNLYPNDSGAIAHTKKICGYDGQPIRLSVSQWDKPSVPKQSWASPLGL
jgi:hypothetical protein